MQQHSENNGNNSMPIGFIGVGTMGYPMIERLFDKGFDPIIYDLKKSCAETLIAKGVRWADSLSEVSSQAKIVLLSLPGPLQVEKVVSGTGGLLHTLPEGSVIVDLSTSSFATSRKLTAQCLQRRIGFLDSPVTGGSKDCREGTHIMMVGGDQEQLELVRPVLKALSRKIVHLGESGAGNIAKLINNQLYLCGQILFYEGIVLANKAGLDISALLAILDSGGAGGIHTKLVDRIFERQYEGNIFTLALAEKDVRLALEASRTLEAPMPVTAAAHQLFEEAKAAGFSNKNFWSTIEIVEKHAKTRIANTREEE
jgi:3-hydroxyisobutyrate dehydrogenase